MRKVFFAVLLVLLVCISVCGEENYLAIFADALLGRYPGRTFYIDEIIATMGRGELEAGKIDKGVSVNGRWRRKLEIGKAYQSSGGRIVIITGYCNQQPKYTCYFYTALTEEDSAILNKDNFTISGYAQCCPACNYSELSTYGLKNLKKINKLLKK